MPRLTVCEGDPEARRSSLLYNPDAGFEVNSLPKSYKGIFKAAGISKTDLKDKDHASKIFEAIRSVSPSVVGDDRPLPALEEKRTGPRSAIVRRPHPPTLKRKPNSPQSPQSSEQQSPSPHVEPSIPPSPLPAPASPPLRAQTLPIFSSPSPTVKVDEFEHPSVFPPSEEIKAGTALQHVQKVVDIKEVSSVSAPSLVGRLKSLVFRPAAPRKDLFGVDDAEEDWSSDDYTLYEGK